MTYFRKRECPLAEVRLGSVCHGELALAIRVAQFFEECDRRWAAAELATDIGSGMRHLVQRWFSVELNGQFFTLTAGGDEGELIAPLELQQAPRRVLEGVATKDGSHVCGRVISVLLLVECDRL